MDATERFRLAKERASRYAPPPAYEPLNAGITVGAAAGAVLAVFAGLSGLGDAFGGAAIAVILLFGGGTWFYFKRQQDAHHKASAAEFANLLDPSAK